MEYSRGVDRPGSESYVSERARARRTTKAVELPDTGHRPQRPSPPAKVTNG